MKEYVIPRSENDFFMPKHYAQLPALNQISSLLAIVLMGFLLIGFVQIPYQVIEENIGGIILSIRIDFTLLATIIVTMIITIGSHSLMSSHPSHPQHNLWQHSWFPALTCFALLTILNQLPPRQLSWWVIFLLGGGLLTSILLCEYISLEPQQKIPTWITLWLKLMGSISLLVLMISWYHAGTRLFILLPVMGLCYIAYTQRMIGLHSGENSFSSVSSAALAATHFSAALFYWQFSPFRFGLFTVSFTYALSVLLIRMKEGKFALQLMVEIIFWLVIVWGLALWFI